MPGETNFNFDNRWNRLSNGDRKNEAIVATELLPTILDPMSSFLTIAGTVPTPLSAILLGSSRGLKILSVGSKLAHYKLTGEIDKGDVIGDIVGLGIGEVTKPIVGDITDMTIDLMSENISSKEVNNNYRIHQPYRVKSSLVRSVALDIGLIDSHSPFENINISSEDDNHED
jgi:hypothetical protein